MSKKEIEIHVDKDNKIDLHEFIEMKIKYDEEYFKKDKEIERLNNIINELEKYIGIKMNSFGVCNASDIYLKLQELKGSNKENV